MPRALTTERIIEAGLATARSHGLSAVGMRAVAARLRVTPMALYRHVGGADDLFDAVLQRILAALPAVGGEGTPADRLRAWAHGARRALAPYPGAARYVLTHWFELAPVLQSLDDLLAVAEAEGLRGFDEVAAVNAIFMFVLMRVEAEQAVREAGALRRSFAATAARHPGAFGRLRANAAHYEVAELDAHFEYGLDVVLAGIAARRPAVRR